MDENKSIETDVVDPDCPVRFVRLIVDGEEAAMIPWNEAEAVAEAIAEYND